MSSVNWVPIYFFSFQLHICIPVIMDCKNKNNPDRFCYISDNVVIPNYQAKITDFVKKAYRDYFGVKLGDQDKPFILHVCYEMRTQGMVKRVCHLSFQWSEGRKSSHELIFLHDNSKRTSTSTMSNTFCHKTNPRPSCSWPRW